MRTICDMCNSEINTSCEDTGGQAYEYSIDINMDTDSKYPTIIKKTGYICLKCMEKLIEFMILERGMNEKVQKVWHGNRQ